MGALLGFSLVLGKPIILFYTLLYKFIVPFRYEVLPACLIVLIGVNTYLAKRVFRYFFDPRTGSFGAIFYGYLLFVAYWLCPLRNEIYLMTLMLIVLLNCLRFQASGRIGYFYANIVLVCGLGITIHPNSFYLVLFMAFFFVAFRIYRTHLPASVGLAVACTAVGLTILLFPSIAEFKANMKYLATSDGHRFLIGVKLARILVEGFYKDGYQYPFVVAALALTGLNLKAAASFLKRPSPQEKILLLYAAALCVHFLMVPSADWKVYSLHFLFPLAFWLTYLLDGDKRKKLNVPLSVAACVLLIVPMVREYHFLDKAGVLIPCGIFIVVLAVSRFTVSRRLVSISMALFVCVYLFGLYTNHRWYRRMSDVLRQTGQTTLVTSPIFEFLGPEYDIRIMSYVRNFAGLDESYPLLLDRVQLERSGLTRPPDQCFQFTNQFIPRIYQEWFLFLPAGGAGPMTNERRE